MTGTPSGHCPRCGFVPPVSLVLSERRGGVSPSFLVSIVLLGVVAVVLALLR